MSQETLISGLMVILYFIFSIGAYAEWWSTQRDVLGQLIPTLVASIQNPETSTSATMALKDITRECTTTILPYAEDLLNSCQVFCKFSY